MDTDGENLALRIFLLHYQNPGVTIAAMRNALRRTGFDGCWPDFVENAVEFATLTKGGAQVWIRYLISLEPKQSKEIKLVLEFSAEKAQGLIAETLGSIDAASFMRPSDKANYIIIDKDYCVFKAFELTDAIQEALEKKLVSVLRLSDLTGISIDGTWEDIQDWRDEFVAQMGAEK